MIYEYKILYIILIMLCPTVLSCSVTSDSEAT